MRHVRTTLAWTWLVVGTLVCGGLSALVGPFDRRGRVWWPLAQVWARGVLRFTGVTGVAVEGGEHLDQVAGAVVMANHESHIDSPALISLSPLPLRFVAKRSLFHIPVFGWALASVGMVPVDRSNRAQAVASLERAADRLRAGQTILVFPEGTRVSTSELAPFKKGGFMMALHAEAPIVVVTMVGTRQVVPVGVTCDRRGPVVALVSPPIPTAGRGEAGRDALMAEVRAEMEAQRTQARAWHAELERESVRR